MHLTTHSQKQLYEALFARNSTPDNIQYFSTPEGQDQKITLPFIIVHTKRETEINCDMKTDGTEYIFDFSQPFTIHDDNEILQRMGQQGVLQVAPQPREELPPPHLFGMPEHALQDHTQHFLVSQGNEERSHLSVMAQNM